MSGSDNASRRVAIPSSQLDVACVLPGTSLQIPASSEAAFSLPNFTYDNQRKLNAGAALPLPQLQGADLKAGPQYSSSSKVVIAAEKATLQTLDENRLAQLIGDCRIRPTCVDRIRKQGDLVVNAALVAEGLGYEFIDQDGRAMSADAVLKNGVAATAGSAQTTATGTRLRAQYPVVLGVTFVRPDVLATVAVCSEQIVFSSEGNSTVTIGGAGGVGNVGAQQMRTASFGTRAEIGASGSESSECNSGYQRNQSAAAASAIVSKGGSAGELTFDAANSARGGHYVTAAGCVLGNPVGITGHDTGAIASATVQGRIAALLRREGDSVLRAVWEAVSGQLSMSVAGPRGNAIADTVGLTGTGSRDIRVSEPGLYTFTFESRSASSANGASGAQSSTAGGRVRVELVDSNARADSPP